MTETVYRRFAPCSRRKADHHLCVGVYYDEGTDTRTICSCEHHVYSPEVTAQPGLFAELPAADPAARPVLTKQRSLF